MQVPGDALVNGRLNLNDNQVANIGSVESDLAVNTNDDSSLTLNQEDGSWNYVEFNQSGTRHAWLGINDENDLQVHKEQGGDIALTGTSVGIGTSSPEGPLGIRAAVDAGSGEDYANNPALLIDNDVESSDQGTALVIEDEAGGGSHKRGGIIMEGSAPAAGTRDIYLTNNINDKSQLMIDNNGNVGIGTTNPDDRLDVEGSARFSGDLTTHQGDGKEEHFYSRRIPNMLSGGNVWLLTAWPDGNIADDENNEVIGRVYGQRSSGALGMRDVKIMFSSQASKISGGYRAYLDAVDTTYRPSDWKLAKVTYKGDEYLALWSDTDSSFLSSRMFFTGYIVSDVPEDRFKRVDEDEDDLTINHEVNYGSYKTFNQDIRLGGNRIENYDLNYPEPGAKKIVTSQKVTPYALDDYGYIGADYSIDSAREIDWSGGYSGDERLANMTVLDSGLLSGNKPYIVEMEASFKCDGGGDCDPALMIGDGEDMVGVESHDNSGGGIAIRESSYGTLDRESDSQNRGPSHQPTSFIMHYLHRPDTNDVVVANALGHTVTHTVTDRELDLTNELDWRFHASSDQDGPYRFESADITIYEISDNEEAMTK